MSRNSNMINFLGKMFGADDDEDTEKGDSYGEQLQ